MYKLLVAILIALNTDLSTSNAFRKVLRNLSRKQQITYVVIESETRGY